MPKKIIVVDDSTFNLNVCQKALKDEYDAYCVKSARNMFDILENTIVDLILLDVEMPDIHGYEAIKMLKDNDLYKNIPVIFLSAMDDAQSEMTGLELGAVDYIHKPFVNSLLLKRVETHLMLAEMSKGNSNPAIRYEMLETLNRVIDAIDLSIGTDDVEEIKLSLALAKSASARLLEQITKAADRADTA